MFLLIILLFLFTETLDIYNHQSIIIASLKDLLHLGVVYWNLILQLLRTNEQFKNVIHETIVIDPCDLQNIVFNSFSCYLHAKQLNIVNDFNDRLIQDVEEWLCANGYSATDNTSESGAVINANGYDLNNCDSLLPTIGERTGIFDIQYDIEYTSEMDLFYTNGVTSTYRSHTDFTNENSFIDSVRSNKCDSVVTSDTEEIVQPEHSIVTGVKKITNFLASNVFDHFFVSSNNIDETKSIDEGVKRIKSDADLSVYVKDYDTAESNSLFLQLFEITAGVMILANWEQSNSGEF